MKSRLKKSSWKKTVETSFQVFFKVHSSILQLVFPILGVDSTCLFCGKDPDPKFVLIYYSFSFSKRNDRNALRQSNPRQHSTNSRVQLSQGELYDYQPVRLSLSLCMCVWHCGCLNTLEKKPQAPTACAIILTFVSVIYYWHERRAIAHHRENTRRHATPLSPWHIQPRKFLFRSFSLL